MINVVNNFITGIKNLITWFPLIWKLPDFDYSYGVGLFIFYLKQLRKGINKYRNHLYWERDIQTIDTFLKMYEFYDNIGYYSRYKEQLKKEGIPEISLLSEEKATKEQIKRRSELFNEFKVKENKLRTLLFKYLEHNIGSWWD